ncbi:hypothetical protein PHYSODRAFT_331850 [Phytophthora sojae]|uniref:Uncharacterized protein n=1 Tax=Phytophthora sojae (strain P6497) TaxID=1094619 RepID=G4ZFK3_PHYSP|nr:hypothetical protein PHYSODRAFT_331850 [Phytophthora sojae]EGZ17940.1 hypothetical protein PHYSODRAFT_331850 [Phytophthora sojae]|eukprot:XP_009526998.1 hypothetical protein PHYSODRAFT_331850 [Phytophthora sojae]
MVKANRATFAGLKFNGDPNDFQRWKDAVVAHLANNTNSLEVSEIQAGRTAPRHGFQDLLLGPAHIVALLGEVDSYIKDIFNQTLPHSYMNQLSTPLSAQTVAAFWQQLEVDLGKCVAMGMGKKLYVCTLLPSRLMVGMVLALLPGYLWGPSITFSQEEFTLEKIETKMSLIFGNKSKIEIEAMDKTTQRPVEIPVNYAARGMASTKKGPMKKSDKRKAMPLPMDDERVNAFFYYNGAILSNEFDNEPAAGSFSGYYGSQYVQQSSVLSRGRRGSEAAMVGTRPRYGQPGVDLGPTLEEQVAAVEQHQSREFTALKQEVAILRAQAAQGSQTASDISVDVGGCVARLAQRVNALEQRFAPAGINVAELIPFHAVQRNASDPPQYI